MKKLGIAVLIIGIIGLVGALMMDTSVDTYGGRVHNIGLMGQQQNFLLVSMATAIAGVLVLVFSSRKQQPVRDSRTDLPVQSATRSCPYCAEQIMAQAKICRFCGRDVEPLAEPEGVSLPAPTVSIGTSLQVKIQNSFAEIEETFRSVGKSVDNNLIAQKCATAVSWLEAHLVTIGVIQAVIGFAGFLYFGIFASTSWAGEHASTIKALWLINTTSVIFSGAILVMQKFLAEKREVIKNPSSQEALEPGQWLFFGKRVDLVSVQVTLIGLLCIAHYQYVSSMTNVAAILVAVTGYFLIRLGRKVFGYVTIVFSILYLSYVHFYFSELDYTIEMSMALLNRNALFSITPYLFILVTSIAIPHLQYLRIGNIRYGNLWGDMALTPFKHKIYLPFVSSLVLCVLWVGMAETPLLLLAFLNMIFR